ncbi:MAG: metal ABC transporter permease [Spirochaetales bacterium]|jgi:zinc transport system permease protein|nr:metal ABC transporter permease [Spirochaetales bacterium]
MTILSYFAYPPILRGFLVLLVAGAFFPLTGVFVLRLNLITFRFMLMHGTLLGGALALGFGIEPLYLGIGINLLLIFGIARISRGTGKNIGHITTFFMVLTIGLAFAVMYRMNVPAKDTLSILWGNLFALSKFDAIFTIGFCLGTFIFVILLFRPLKAVIFSREIAYTSGVRERGLYHLILVFTGLTIAFAMKLIGALLLDALLLLPALMATFFARSTKEMFVLAGFFGFLSSISGFFASLALDIPASSAVTVVAALFLGVIALFKFFGRNRA